MSLLALLLCVRLHLKLESVENNFSLLEKILHSLFSLCLRVWKIVSLALRSSQWKWCENWVSIWMWSANFSIYCEGHYWNVYRIKEKHWNRTDNWEIVDHLDPFCTFGPYLSLDSWKCRIYIAHTIKFSDYKALNLIFLVTRDGWKKWMGDRQNLDIYANNMWMQKKYILWFAPKKSYDQ